MMIRRRFQSPMWPALVAFALVAAVGCSQEGEQSAVNDATEATVTLADSVAFSEAMDLEDDAAKLKALEQLVDTFPSSEWSGRAYPYIYRLTGEADPTKVEALLREVKATNFTSSYPYNAIGWDLAVKSEHLDLAIPILEKAVGIARAGGDEQDIASCLDSEAWARHQHGDIAGALDRMEEAYAIYGAGNDEIDEHMALIYDAAGRHEAAKGIYVDLLSHMENREIREHLEKIVQTSGQSVDLINTEINRMRLANATPVPDLTLPSLADGQQVSIADFRGKVVMLSFWHPT